MRSWHVMGSSLLPKGKKLVDFQELAIEAHDMEVVMEQAGDLAAPIPDPHKKGKAIAKEPKEKAKGSYVTKSFTPMKIQQALSHEKGIRCQIQPLQQISGKKGSGDSTSDAAKANVKEWILVTRRKKPIQETELLKTITSKAKQSKRRAAERHNKTPRTNVQGVNKRKRRPVTLAKFFHKDFLTPPPAMVATCSSVPPLQETSNKKFVTAADRAGGGGTTGGQATPAKETFLSSISGYNQIRMDPKDEELTAFRTPKGIFCYKVMPFGLKNAGATYQRAMQNIFDDFLHKRVECYVDDLVVKTKQRANHLLDLRAVFERLRRFQLKMNPLKCAFGVTSGKFLGFLVHHRGIEIDQSKIDAIQKMPVPRNVSELKSFQGHLAYIRRFISNLAGRCQHFSRLLKKGTPFEWDDACRNAFNNIKAYLTKPPVLVAPIVDKPLLLYIAAQEKSVGALLAQCDEDNKERSLYYLNRTLVGAELNYTPIEKTCLALIFAVQKLRHYLLAHSTNLISRADPLKYIMSRPILSGRLAKWALLLSKFEINFVPQRAIKGQALANFLADHPVPAEWELTEEFPDEEIFLVEVLPPWDMYFDGAARRNGASAGVLFVSPKKDLLPYSFVLSQICSNNEAEYQAILLGLGIAVEMQLPQLNIYDDSALVIKQLSREFEVMKLELEPLWRYASELLAQIPEVSLHYVPRSENGPADALAGIAASLSHFDERPNQRKPIINFLCHSTLPVDLRERVQIRRTAPRYVFFNDVLYRRSYEGLLLRCLSKEEGMQVLKETHGGICGAHQAGPKLHLQVKRLGYYWPTMLRDAIEMARTCKSCQLHADYIHQPPVPLHPTVASWPFEAWGMDIIGPITPKSDFERQYILAATDYFSKWAEAATYREVKATTVADFIRTQLIYRYGVPRYIVTDNGTPFRNRVMDCFCEKFCIQQRMSSAYNPAANGLAEAFNKTLCKILKKTVGTHKRSWDEKLPEALWAYRTTARTPTQSTQYLLVYGSEAVLPLEVQLPSLRIAVREGLTTEECAQLRLAELESLDEQ
ncbi:hypothetical protein H6P81_013324 [Aristolochia fimbriata]|uniref:Uncharacterized protein n=1 Tax=Aristolochia fimbriata TaxID=158543 RepID=A0AAV7EHJ7_ARIFI|nr:hypothetical protein H6P81_013324 [Aristolochia fimbriata]